MNSAQHEKNISLLIWLAIAILCAACAVDEQDIEGFSRRELANYIEKNVQNPEKEKLVGLAITKLFSWDIIGVGWRDIRESFYTQFDSDLQVHSLLVVGRDQKISFLQRTVGDYLQRGWKEDYQEALNLMNIAVEANLKPIDSLRVIQNTLQQIVDLVRSADSLRSQELDLGYAVRTMNDKIEETERWLAQNRPEQISGYIRSLKEDGLYEISIGQHSALLITTDSRFETVGRFSMYATELGEIPVTLREEYGGFIQEWGVYREVPEAKRETLISLADEKSKLLSSMRKEVSPDQEKLRIVESNLEKIPNQIKALKRLCDGLIHYTVLR